MSILGRAMIVAVAAAGGLTASQLPEFAQQYRQRLGGALEEMRRIVADFEADASRSNLTREEALATYSGTPETFLRDQGASMRGTVGRFDRLSEQRARLESAPPIMRPVVVMSRPDPRLFQGAWADYEPAVPVTSSGFVWAAIGFFLAGGLVSLIAQLVGIARRRRRFDRARIDTAQPP